MNRSAIVCTLGLVLLSGCYVSPVPIDTLEEAPVLPGLAGEWIQTGHDADEAPMRLQINRVSDTFFDMVATSTDPEEDEVLRMQGYASLIGDHYFGNLKLLDEEEEGYLLVRFERTGDTAMRVYLVSDDMMDDPPVTRAALRAFLEAHVDNPALYEDDAITFTKVN